MLGAAAQRTPERYQCDGWATGMAHFFAPSGGFLVPESIVFLNHHESRRHNPLPVGPDSLFMNAIYRANSSRFEGRPETPGQRHEKQKARYFQKCRSIQTCHT